MLYKEYIKIKVLALHIVGNKLNKDSLGFSKYYIELSDELEYNLSYYFLSHFKSEEQYHFFSRY